MYSCRLQASQLGPFGYGSPGTETKCSGETPLSGVQVMLSGSGSSSDKCDALMLLNAANPSTLQCRGQSSHCSSSTRPPVLINHLLHAHEGVESEVQQEAEPPLTASSSISHTRTPVHFCPQHTRATPDGPVSRVRTKVLEPPSPPLRWATLNEHWPRGIKFQMITGKAPGNSARPQWIAL